MGLSQPSRPHLPSSSWPSPRRLRQRVVLATGNTTLQLESEPSMRGRVMSLWAVAFMGTTPVGGPLLGWIVATTNGRVGLGVGALACLLAAAIGVTAAWKLTPRLGQRTRNAASPIGVSSVLTYRRDRGVRRPDAAPRNHCLNGRPGTFEDRLDRSVVAVAHLTADRARDRLFPAGFPEPHALDPSLGDYSSSDDGWCRPHRVSPS